MVDLPIRLVDGETPYSGRVEIYRNGVWGTVCNDNWSINTNNAEVVCQQLGFGTGGIVHYDTPEGTGPILMDDVQCGDSQNSLFACAHSGFGYHNCYHFEDVGVTCNRSTS